jgi:hypothetical protein
MLYIIMTILTRFTSPKELLILLSSAVHVIAFHFHARLRLRVVVVLVVVTFAARNIAVDSHAVIQTGELAGKAIGRPICAIATTLKIKFMNIQKIQKKTRKISIN